MLPQLAFIASVLGLYVLYANLQYTLVQHPAYLALPENRQLYVTKNIIKGGYLCVLVVWASIVVLPDVARGHWNSWMIATFGSLYCSNDFVGLLRVHGLPMSTRLHHICCLSLLMVAWTVEFQYSNIGQLIVFYTFFSAAAFPVNLYLGLRLIMEDTEWLRTISKWVYVISCALNWALQAYWFKLSTDTSWYMCLIFGIIYDDIVLIRWLWRV
jgi:hypothetical protein